MRTNIEIDDKLMTDAMKLSGAKTKKAAVDQALELLIQVKKQEESFSKLFGMLKSEERPGKLPGKDKWKEAEQRYAAEARSSRKKAA